MSKKSVSIWAMGERGQIIFNARNKTRKERHQPDSVWNHSIFLVLMIGACAIIDYYCFKSLFDSFLLDKPVVRSLSIGAMLFAFDFIPIYLGMNLRKRMQGYNVAIPIIISMASCFIIAFGANVLLRIVFKDLAMPDLSEASTSMFGSVNTETATSSRAMPYAVFSSILPLLTSIGSFLISYTMSNPLKQEMKQLEKEHSILSDNIGQLEAILAEYEADPDFFNRITRDDEEKYEIMRWMIFEKREKYRDDVRQRIKEYLRDATANSELSIPLKEVTWGNRLDWNTGGRSECE